MSWFPTPPAKHRPAPRPADARPYLGKLTQHFATLERPRDMQHVIGCVTTNNNGDITMLTYAYYILLCLPKIWGPPNQRWVFFQNRHSNRLGPTTPNSNRWESGFVWKLCDNLKIQGRDHQVHECIGLVKKIYRKLLEFNGFLPPILAVKNLVFP
jgi:hypothetical protein